MQTIVVGTDGSQSASLAVERAATLATAFDATLVIGCAYYESVETAQKTLNRDSISIIGHNTAHNNLNNAADIAKKLGATKIKTTARPGTPAHTLMEIVQEYNADLLIVGNRGINSLTGRLLGSIPADIARQSRCDVMIVHTVDQ